MRMFLRWLTRLGLTQKAVLIFLPLVILPFLLIGIAAYHQITTIVTEQFVETTMRNMESVVNQLEEQTATVKDIADYLLIHPSLSELLRPDADFDYRQEERLRQHVINLLTFHQFTKPYIRSISIYGYNGKTIEMGEPIFADETKWIEEAVQRRGAAIWTESYTALSGWGREAHLLSLIRLLRSITDGIQPKGELVIRLDAQYFMSQLKQALYKDSGHIFVFGSDGDLVLRSDDSFSLALDELAAAWTWRQSGFMEYKWDGTNYLAFYRMMEPSMWRVVVLIPEALVKEETTAVRLMVAAMITLLLLFFSAALYGLHSTIIRPVLRLKDVTNRVKSGDFNAKVPIRSKDEIADLSRNFNEMVMTIRQLINQRYKLVLREKESELKQLQNQIDPHFLYNTLDMIRWTARLEHANKTSELIEVLSKFFRYGASRSREYVTTIQQELEFVQAYLYLQKKRLGNRLSYSIFTEATIADAPILKTTIQPLVENSIKHGLDKKQKANHISVKCYAAGDDIWIDVQDNGKGIPPESLAALRFSISTMTAEQEKTGALLNIHDRLSIYFGKKYGVEIVSSSPQGTLVRLKIPNAGAAEGV